MLLQKVNNVKIYNGIINVGKIFNFWEFDSTATRVEIFPQKHT